MTIVLRRKAKMTIATHRCIVDMYWEPVPDIQLASLRMMLSSCSLPKISELLYVFKILVRYKKVRKFDCEILNNYF